MPPLIHHAALVAACCALGAVGLRAAAACGAAGLTRVVAGAPLAVAVAVLETLLLGRLGVSDHAGVLLACAVVTALAARTLLPAPSQPLLAAWRDWWDTSDLRTRVALGAAGGVWVAWTSWQMRFPHLDVDGLIYHLPLVASWMPDGNAGAATPLIEGLPVGNYPLTNEVALAWAMGLSDSLVWLSVWQPLLWLLTALAGWIGLRALDVPRWVAAAAVAAVVTMPLFAVQLGGPLTDLPALAWAVTCAALCVLSTRPGGAALLGPALVAAGVAVGTKTTPAPLLLVALAFAFWRSRAALRPIAVRVLTPCVALGSVVGLAWMARNLVDHGSPLWPFVEGPGGDPLPPALVGFDLRFLDAPADMLRGREDLYAETVSGGVWLLAGAILLPILCRSRRSLLLLGASLLGVLAWANAPYTGIQEPDSLAVGATRYLLPALACAACAIAVSTADAGGRRWLRALGGGVLVLAALVSISRMGDLGFPYTPSWGTIIAGAILGAVVVLVQPWTSRLDARLRITRLAPLVVAAFVTVILAGQADQYLIRHAGMQLFDRPVLGAMLQDPSFSIGDGRTTAMAPATLGVLAGEDLQHRLELIARDEPCARTRARIGEGWVVAQILPATPRGEALVACMQGLREFHRDGRYVVWTQPPDR